MCGRYAVTLPPEFMQELFRTSNFIDFPPRYNIAPTQPVVAIWEEQGRRTSKLARWGLVPGWVKDPRDFSLIINARGETMAEKPAFRGSLRNQRCIIPASGYYEWHTGPDKKKQPYYITLANDEPMALAGLYSTWMGPNGEEIDTVASVTVAANADLDHIHDRMPVILRGDAVDDWLNTRDVDVKGALHLAQPLPPGAVRFHPVSARVGSNRVDDPDLLKPIDLSAEEAVATPPPRPKKPAPPKPDQLDLF